MKKTLFPEIELFVTSKCTESCELCNQENLMKSKTYDMSLESITKFIYYTKKSNYKFHVLRVSGGESLLWSNLVEGLRLLKDSKIANYITINTAANLNLVKKKTVQLEGLLQHPKIFLRISNYWFNQPGIEFLRQSKFCGPNKMRLVECRFFEVPPVKINEIPNIEDSVCDGPSLAFYDDKIIWCANLLTLMHRFQLTEFDEASKQKITPITENYAEKITSVQRWGKEMICGGCVSCTGVKSNSVPNINKRIKNSKVSIFFVEVIDLTLEDIYKCFSAEFIKNHHGMLEIIFCGFLNKQFQENLSKFCAQNNFICRFLEVSKNASFFNIASEAIYEKIFVTHPFIKLPSDLITVLSQRSSFSSCFVPNVQNRQNPNYAVFGGDKNSLKSTDLNINLNMSESDLLLTLQANNINVVRTWHELSYTEDLRNNLSPNLDQTVLNEVIAPVASSKHNIIPLNDSQHI